MKHVTWLLPDLVAARPGPAIAPWDPADLFSGGLRVIVSLDSTHVDPTALTGYGFEHHSVGMLVDWALEDTAEPGMIAAVRTAESLVHGAAADGRPVLVHCLHGRDRTGTVLACHLALRHGRDPVAAVEEVRERVSGALPSPGAPALVTDLVGHLRES